MKVVDHKDLNELCACIGKKCHIVLDTIGLPISEFEGLLTNVEIHTNAPLIRIVIEVEGASVKLQVRYIRSMSIEE